MKKIILFLAMLGMVLAFGTVAYGGQSGGTINATTSYGTIPECTLSFVDIAFPPYVTGPGGSIPGSGTVNVNCPDSIPTYEVCINGGKYKSGIRRMFNQTSPNEPDPSTDPNDFISYELTRPDSSLWGDNEHPDPAGDNFSYTNGFCYAGGPVIGVDDPITVTGDMTGGLTPSSGSYSDELTVTVFW